LLCDGRCRSLDELQEVTNLSKRQIEAAVEFMLKFGFAEMKKGIEVRITRDAEKFFAQTF
jgi:hypothetical protein